MEFADPVKQARILQELLQPSEKLRCALYGAIPAEGVEAMLGGMQTTSFSYWGVTEARIVFAILNTQLEKASDGYVALSDIASIKSRRWLFCMGRYWKLTLKDGGQFPLQSAWRVPGLPAQRRNLRRATSILREHKVDSSV